jgi:hypothetical protein
MALFSGSSGLSPPARTEIALVISILAIVVAIKAMVVVAQVWWGIDYYDLVRDPNAIAGNPHYFGIVSNLGIVLWLGGATCALLAHATSRHKRNGTIGTVLFYGGIFAALMGLDDLFMLHESAGIGEQIVLLPHALLLLIAAFHVWRARAETPWPLFAAAFVSFALSLAFDLCPAHFPGQVFVEESFKLLGIAMLSAYLLLVSLGALKQPAR